METRPAESCQQTLSTPDYNSFDSSLEALHEDTTRPKNIRGEQTFSGPECRRH